MEYKVFDVVELKNNNLATILDKINNTYKVEEIDSKAKIQKITEITDNDIKKIKYSK